MAATYESLLEKAMELGASGARLINTSDVAFDPRAYLKCRFGCKRWGKYWTCPPNLGITPETFMEGYRRYRKAVIIKTADPKKGQDVALGIEKEAMLNHGCPFAFALALCVACETCAYPDPCRFPHLARPAMDAYGVDIGKTLEPLGLKVELDDKGELVPAWYSMVLLD